MKLVTSLSAVALGVLAALPVAANIILYTGAVTSLTITTTGIYEITAYGGQGGGSLAEEASGGFGAMADGRIFLSAGTLLEIVVGGQGGSIDGYGNGGGGGSFVYLLGAPLPLMVAGGGGGSGSYFPANDGDPGQSGTAGTAGFGAGGGFVGGAGGTNGAGGGGGTTLFSGAGGGGAGWLGNGGNGENSQGTASGDGGFGPPTFAGGSGDGVFTGGGFGGGGGGGGYGGGGGGGYSGGGGGIQSPTNFIDFGGGGGSYIDASFTNTTLVAGSNSGNGLVVVNLVPEASSFALVGGALGLLAFARRRRA